MIAHIYFIISFLTENAFNVQFIRVQIDSLTRRASLLAPITIDYPPQAKISEVAEQCDRYAYHIQGQHCLVCGERFEIEQIAFSTVCIHRGVRGAAHEECA
jgi:hypothetical protein